MAMDASSRFITIKPTVVEIREKVYGVRTRYAARGRVYVMGEDQDAVLSPIPPDPGPIIFEFDAQYWERGGFSYQIQDGELLFVANYIEMGNMVLDMFKYPAYTFAPERSFAGGSDSVDVFNDGNIFTTIPETEFDGGTENVDVNIDE